MHAQTFLSSHRYIPINTLTLEEAHPFIFPHRQCYIKEPKMASFYFFTAGCNPLAEKPVSTKLSFYIPVGLNIGLGQRICLDFP